MSDARLLLDLLPKPVALVDTALIVHDANRAFITRFGLARSHEGAPARGQFWEGLARTVARMQPAAKLGAFRWTGHDGDDRRFDVRATRVADNRFLVVADDVSEYLEVEAIQGGVRHYVEGVLNHLPQGLLVLDAAFHVTFYNAAQADLWREEPEMPLPLETIGLPVWQVHRVFAASEWEDLGRQLRAGAIVRRPRQPFGRGGRPVDVSLLPLADGEGTFTGAVCLTEDVSRQVAIEAEHLNRERLAAVGETAMSLQHEIANPLTAILGTAEALLASGTLAPAVKSRVEAIKAGALRAADSLRRLAPAAGPSPFNQ